MSNFGCIGFVTPDRNAFARMLNDLLDAAKEEVALRARAKHLRWTDDSGAAVAFHMRDDAIECITPFFAPTDGLSRWHVRTSAAATDRGCVHCSGADCDVLDADGGMVTRATVQWLHFVPWQAWLEQPRTFELEVVLFAHRAMFASTKEEFLDGQRGVWLSPGEELKRPDGEPLRLAENAFMPEGMFAREGASITTRATVLAAGKVDRVERLVNRRSKQPFFRVRIETLPGALDVVMAAVDANVAPASGMFSMVRGWLVGRPVGPPPAPRTWWRSLLGGA